MLDIVVCGEFKMKTVNIFSLHLYIMFMLCPVRNTSSTQSLLQSLLYSKLNDFWDKWSALEGETLTARIVGGQVARNGEFPYMVAIRSSNGKLLCGGSLINSQHVLTAAHCVRGLDPAFIRAMMGTLQLSDFQTSTERGISQLWTHNGFNFNSFDWDVAVLKLSSPVPLTASVQPICLSVNTAERINGRRAMVVGWGRRKEADRRSSDNLRKVNVPIVNGRVCQRSYRSFRSITDRMLCAGFRRGGRDSCQGDSGGPMVWRSGAKISQLGIVSWGNGCARPGYYGVYTRISKVVPWIKSITNVQECS